MVSSCRLVRDRSHRGHSPRTLRSLLKVTEVNSQGHLWHFSGSLIALLRVTKATSQGHWGHSSTPILKVTEITSQGHWSHFSRSLKSLLKVTEVTSQGHWSHSSRSLRWLLRVTDVTSQGHWDTYQVHIIRCFRSQMQRLEISMIIPDFSLHLWILIEITTSGKTTPSGQTILTSVTISFYHWNPCRLNLPGKTSLLCHQGWSFQAGFTVFCVKTRHSTDEGHSNHGLFLRV